VAPIPHLDDPAAIAEGERAIRKLQPHHQLGVAAPSATAIPDLFAVFTWPEVL
jgi:hypothetical protein